MILTFGKYKGDDIEDVPNRYLEYLLDNSIGDKVFLDKINDEMCDRDRFEIIIKD